MSINEEHRQVEVAAEVEAAVRTLAHSARSVPSPSDFCKLLGELEAATRSLGQVIEQLAAWHEGVIDGLHYAGEDERGDGATGTVAAAAHLHRPAGALREANAAIEAGGVKPS